MENNDDAKREAKALSTSAAPLDDDVSPCAGDYGLDLPRPPGMVHRHTRLSKRDMGSLQRAHRVARRAASRSQRSRSRRGQAPP